MNKIKIVTFSLLALCLQVFCINREKETLQISEEDSLYCGSMSRANSVVSDQNLETDVLDEINVIQTNKAIDEPFLGRVKISGGAFEMGGDTPDGFENIPKTALPQGDKLPKHKDQINAFWMDEHEVTNAQFRVFVDATGYITIAERTILWEDIKNQVPPEIPEPPKEKLLPGSLVFHYADKNALKDNLENWWIFVKGANWLQPKGPGSSIEGFDNYPVTQVSCYDAVAYTKWGGKRLPTEAEYEYAMRGGQPNQMYPWGNDKTNEGEFYANHLQGEFPYTNTKDDSFEYLAPIKSFPSNGYGLYDIAGKYGNGLMIDAVQHNYYELVQSGSISKNPQGPEEGFETQNNFMKNKSLKGGSFLCHDGWCSGYRNARRLRTSPDTSLERKGSKGVKDLTK